MIRRPPRSTLSSSSAASDVYKRQVGYACGSRLAYAGVEASAELELPDSGVGSAGQSGVPPIYTGGWKQGARRQDAGTTSPGFGAGGHTENSSPRGGHRA